MDAGRRLVGRRGARGQPARDGAQGGGRPQGRQGQAAGRRMSKSVRLGIAPIAWSNDDLPQLGGDTPLETCLAESRLAGFSGVETGGKFPKTSAELGPLLKKHQLALASGWYSGTLLDSDLQSEKAKA